MATIRKNPYYTEIDSNGDKHWYLNGNLHRVDGPAVEWSDGSKEWYLNGKRHRVDGPAIECSNGDKFWWLNGKRHRVDGPNFIIATVIETEPGIKGDSSKSGFKPAKIDTGASVSVPLFIATGETIKVDTRTGMYVERAKK